MYNLRNICFSHIYTHSIEESILILSFVNNRPFAKSRYPYLLSLAQQAAGVTMTLSLSLFM